MFRTTNPTMKEEVFTGQAIESGPPMTMAGAIGKSSILLVLLLITAPIGWVFASMPLLIGSAIGGLVLALAIGFKPNWAPIAAPIYALIEGLFVGSMSFVFSTMLVETAFPNAVPLAVMGTIVTFGVMLGLYATRIIKVTQQLKSIIIGATAAIMITYFASWVLSIFFADIWNMPIYGSSWIGIAFSVLVIGIAAFNLLLDFDLIETGVNSRAPQYMEWYAGFALLVTLIWLYIEILRLISKIARR